MTDCGPSSSLPCEFRTQGFVRMKEDWAYTEERLEIAAGSMGHLLAQIRPQVSSGLVGGAGWERILERAAELPATMGAFPFGFEIPLHDARPIADFGVTLVGGSRTAAGYQRRARADGTDRSAAVLAELLDETDRTDSLLRLVVGRKMLLEYDIDPEPDGAWPDPGIFLYPVDDILSGGGERLEELGAVHDAVVQVGGWNQDPAERRELERLYRTLQPDTLIRAFGTFPSRDRTMRIAATGFRTARDVEALLKNGGWPGQAEVVRAIVSYFEEHDAFAYLGLHFDVTCNGVGPMLGLSFFAREQEWLKHIRFWAALIDGIRELGIGLPEKMEELAGRSTGSTTLIARSGPVMLVKGIHHIKLAITGEKVEKAKAYVFFLMMCRRSKGGIGSG